MHRCLLYTSFTLT